MDASWKWNDNPVATYKAVTLRNGSPFYGGQKHVVDTKIIINVYQLF